MDRRSLSRQVRDALREMIVARQYRVGDQLPSEETLAELFKVSRPTIREALKFLEEEKTVICRHGAGRFVASDPASLLQQEITRLEGVTTFAERQGIKISTRVLSLTLVEADETVRTNLRLTQGSQVYVLERVRLSKEEPVIYSVDIFPQSLVKGNVAVEDFAGSLLSVMQEKWGERLSYSRANIRAVMLEKAVCEKISVKQGQPWILLEQVNYSKDDRALLYSRDYHRGDKFQFSVIRRA